MDDGRFLVGVAILGLAVLGVARGSRATGAWSERADRRAMAELDGLAATGETLEEATARLGAALYERQRGAGLNEHQAYREAWMELDDGFLAHHADLDPEAVNAMYERFVNEGGK